MALFNRWSETVPEWSPFAAAGDWRTFAEAVRAQAKARGWTLDLGAGLAAGGRTRYGLTNIAQQCAAVPREDWPGLVRAHFERVAAAASPRFGSAEEARGALKARLVDDEFFAHVTFESAWRRVADTLRLVLAFDLPETVVVADRAEVLEWGDEDELFEIALDNVRLEPGLELERHPLEHTAVWSLSGDSFFTSTHALWADGFDPPPSAHGTLVAVPSRHIVLAHPIRDGAVLRALTAMLDMAARFHAAGPGSLSRALYWLRDGELERLDARLDAGGVKFVPSDGFTAVIERL